MRQELQAIAALSARGNTLVLPRPPLIDSAPLECALMPLQDSIARFARQVKSQGVQQVKICPLFLLNGIHVSEDIPAEVAAARSQLSGEIELKLLPYFGSRPEMVQLLAVTFASIPARGRILLAHGSRRTLANQTIEAMARKLDALPAYWHILPDLETQIAHLVTGERKNIAIQPYFLFTGGITDAIAREIQRLQAQFTDANLYLGTPLGATPNLARLIRNWIES